MLAPGTFALRPIALRHPLLFYLGHLPAFAYNQIGGGALSLGPLHPEFDQLFSMGIDPESVHDAPSLSGWPSIEEIVLYRDRVRETVLSLVEQVLAREKDILCEHGRVLSLVIEHELMHHETLQYLFAQCPDGALIAPTQVGSAQGGAGRAAKRLAISSGVVTLGARFEALEFGWDNEFGQEHVAVKAFALDDLPVRNSDWLSFMRATGHEPPESFVLREGEYYVRTVFGAVPFALAEGWPVQVSAVQARRYCAWRGGRLPTEAELHHAARASVDSQQWAAPALVDWAQYFPNPVGFSPESESAFGIQELVGNGWEWTSTVFAPREGFVPWARSYPGYSADFFDGEHDVVFGGSWATDRSLLRPSFRNWYRRNYPYAFTSFRVAWDE